LGVEGGEKFVGIADGLYIALQGVAGGMSEPFGDLVGVMADRAEDGKQEWLRMGVYPFCNWFQHLKLITGEVAYKGVGVVEVFAGVKGIEAEVVNQCGSALKVSFGGLEESGVEMEMVFEDGGQAGVGFCGGDGFGDVLGGGGESAGMNAEQGLCGVCEYGAAVCELDAVCGDAGEMGGELTVGVREGGVAILNALESNDNDIVWLVVDSAGGVDFYLVEGGNCLGIGGHIVGIRGLVVVQEQQGGSGFELAVIAEGLGLCAVVGNVGQCGFCQQGDEDNS